MTEKGKSELGPCLRALRETMGLSLRAVEERAGISNAFLSQLESGRVKHPSPFILYKLANTYGVPYEALMEHAGYPMPATSEQPSLPQSPKRIFHRIGDDITDEEEEALLDYLAFIRSRNKKRGYKE
jgi:transcriptional regulator with XRE-family HTH domain